MAGRYGSTKADWWNDFSNNMASSTQNAMAMMLREKLGQKSNSQEADIKSKLLKEQSNMELQNAIRKAAAEGLIGGTLQSDDQGININSLMEDNFDFSKLRPATMEENIGLGGLGKSVPGGADASLVGGITEQDLANGVDIEKLKRGIISKKFGVPYEQLMPQEEKSRKLSDDLQKSIAKKELESMATALPKLDQAHQAVSQLEDLYYKGATPDKNAFGARTTGVLDIIGSWLGANPNLRQYSKNRSGFSGLIAKGGFGESGMLTNPDIERMKSMLPNAQATEEEAKIAFDEIKKLLSSARDRFESKKDAYVSGDYSGGGKFTGGRQSAASGESQGQLPEGMTMEDVQFTAQKYGITPEEVLKKIRGGR